MIVLIKCTFLIYDFYCFRHEPNFHVIFCFRRSHKGLASFFFLCNMLKLSADILYLFTKMNLKGC